MELMKQLFTRIRQAAGKFSTVLRPCLLQMHCFKCPVFAEKQFFRIVINPLDYIIKRIIILLITISRLIYVDNFFLSIITSFLRLLTGTRQFAHFLWRRCSFRLLHNFMANIFILLGTAFCSNVWNANFLLLIPTFRFWIPNLISVRYTLVINFSNKFCLLVCLNRDINVR